MLFSSKIRETAKLLGLTVQGLRDPAALATAAAAGAKLVIVDLRLPMALAALDALAGDPLAAAVPSVGFIDHERTDVMDAASARGMWSGHGQGAIRHRAAQLLTPLVPRPAA